MDHHADLVLFQAQRLAASASKTLIDDLHFEEVVAAAERAALLGAALDGVVADTCVRVGRRRGGRWPRCVRGRAATPSPRSMTNRGPSPISRRVSVRVELVLARSPDAGRDGVEQRLRPARACGA